MSDDQTQPESEEIKKGFENPTYADIHEVAEPPAPESSAEEGPPKNQDESQ